MKWIVSLITLIVLVILLILVFRQKKSKEKTPMIFLLFAFIVYHIGDMGLWGGCEYEMIRRIASAGFYFVIPFSLWLMYILLPNEKMTMLIRIVTLILMLPWLYAFIVLYKAPLVFLEDYPGTEHETLTYLLILSFVIAVLFAAIVGFRASKFRDDYGKRLAKFFYLGLIIYTIIILILFSSIDAFGYDATWFFGVATVIYSMMLYFGSTACKSKSE